MKKIKIIIILFLFYSYAEAKTIIIQKLADFSVVKNIGNCKYIICSHIDLKGRTIELAKYSNISFRNGSLCNGIVIGSQTTIKTTKGNLFHNCVIKGTWKVNRAYSSMFDSELPTMRLFQNMSSLSKHLYLSANREYRIVGKGEELNIETLSSINNSKPKIEFHTENPNVDGIKIFGKNVTIKNICFTGDYHVSNDSVYGTNNNLIGNMISICSHDKIVNSLVVEGCEFCGGTSSSYVASSQTRYCKVKNCSFSGYLADHAVYCSMNIIDFSVEDCSINDIVHTKGLFKIRTSPYFRFFYIGSTKAHNLNGYMAIVSLLKTPESEVRFDNINVTKDGKAKSVFYGFCITDETEHIMDEYSHNVNTIKMEKCHFGYGYEGFPIITSGAHKPVYANIISYKDITASQSIFGGGNADSLIVEKSKFLEFQNKKGLTLQSRNILISKTTIVGKNEESSKGFIVLNYGDSMVENFLLKNCKVDVLSNQLVNVVKGNRLALTINNCKISSVKKLVDVPEDSNVDIISNNNTVVQ